MPPDTQTPALPNGVYSINPNSNGSYQVDTDTRYGRSSVLFDPNNPQANATGFASLGISNLLPTLHSYFGLAAPTVPTPSVSTPVQTSYSQGRAGTPVTQPPQQTSTATTGAPAAASFAAGYYKDPTSGAFFQKAADGTVSIVTNAQTENQLKSGGIASTQAPYTSVASSGRPVAPSAVSTIGSTVTAPAGGVPTPPSTAANAPTLADQFNTSLAATIASQQSQLQNALAAQQQNYQSQVDSLKQQSADLVQLQEAGLANENSTVMQETQAKQAALDQEQQQFQQNYQARQQLTDQLTTLLTTGQQVIEGMKGTTGLASIMNPRISQTMTDVQAQAGVITAALSAYSDQIGLAQNQLASATSAITSIYKDQIDYWNNVVSFYNDQQKTTDAKVTTLSAQEKTYVDAQIQILQDNVTNTQKTASAIQTAMMDPTTALAYAKSGVTLTDSPAQISQKLATYEASQQMVWGAPKLVGGDYIQTNKLTGETRTVVANVAKSGPSPAAAVGSDLTDAYAAIKAGADPQAVRQAFLGAHPSSASDWNSYFGSGEGTATNPIVYPTPASSGDVKSGGFLNETLNSIGNWFSSFGT